ncbi:hypothetical protein ACFX16_003501 [Malus domestica]
MPSMLKSVPRCLLRAKFSSPLERLVTINNDKVDSATKVASRPTPSAAEIDSSAGKEETARVGAMRNALSLLLGRLLRSVHF